MSFTSVTERQPSLAWDFNGTTTDYVSGLTGTTTGTATYNSGGKYGQSLIMNGSSYVKYSKTLGYNLGTGGATFAMWFKLLAIPVGTNFWIFGASGTSYSDRIYILVGTTGYIGWTFIDNTLSGKVLSSPSPLVVGTWTHLTFSLFNGTMTMYINGSQVATRSDAPMSGVVLDTQFSIAALAGGSGDNINAEYDDLRIFDRALTSIQVNDIYNQQGVPGRAVQTLAYPYDNVGITSSAAGLWSTRRLRSAYAGPVVNVRRNSDNSQLDFIADQFGNLSNVQSAVTIDAWLTSTTGNVTTWYDQFRSNNFTQTTATSQPQIVKNAGKWVVFFNRDNLTGVPTFYSRMTIPNQISGIKTILYGINTIANTFETLLGQSGIDNAGFRMIGGDFFIGANGNDGNDFLFTGGRAGLAVGTYLTYWYNNNKFGSSLNIVNDSNPLNQWGLVIGSTPGYTSFGFNSLSDPRSDLLARTFYGYLSEIAMFTDQISQVDAGSLYAAQYISRTSSATLTGTPLFSQLSPAATSSAVGAFSLRAVNGVSTRAVNVRAQAQFPPSAMTSAAVVSGGGLVFTQTLSGGFSTGQYVVSCSRYDYGWSPRGAFDLSDVIPSSGGIIWQVNSAYTTGSYTGATTTAGYGGEWIQVQVPSLIKITSYYFMSVWTDSFVLLGSTDASTWTLIDTQTGIVDAQKKTVTGLNPSYYSYYRFVITKSYTNVSYPGFNNIILYGSNASWNTDFYADERGNLLTAPVVGTTLQNWLGGATGYVTTWYDQSGRGNHAIQNTAANQPIIQRATKGPGYACLFNGTTNFLTGMSYTVLNATNFSFNVVERRTGSSSGGTASNDLTLLSCGDFGATGKLLYLIYRNNTNSLFGSWSPELYSTVTAYNSSTEPIRYTSATASSTSGRRVYIYNDPLGNPISASDATQTSLMSMTSGNFQIGYYTFGSSTSYYKGEIYEVLVFTQSLYDLDTSGGLITQVYQNQLGTYGT